MPSCTRCGKEAAPADKYCLSCGQAIVPTSYCPDCGRPSLQGESYCTQCGFDLKSRAGAEAPQGLPSAPLARGLTRNSLVYLTHEGLRGFKVRSDGMLTLALFLPFLLIATSYFFLRAAPVLYLTVWIAGAGILYDELRWRGLRGLMRRSFEDLHANVHSWLVPWGSLRMADWNGRTLWFSSANPQMKASATFDAEVGQSVERTLAAKGVRYAWRAPRLPPRLTQYWTLVALLFIVAQAIMILAATLPFFPGEQQMYTTILNNTTSQVAGASALGKLSAIYLNNIQVAWGGAVPYLGALSFAAASYNTGRVIQVIAIGDQVSSSIVLISLYILPHTWVEELSYPLATIAGVLSVTRWRSVSPVGFARRLNWGSTRLVLALGAAALTLLFADVLEVLTTYLRFAGVILWVPVALVLYLLISWDRKRRNTQPQ